jgi:hypothetical protein
MQVTHGQLQCQSSPRSATSSDLPVTLLPPMVCLPGKVSISERTYRNCKIINAHLGIIILLFSSRHSDLSRSPTISLEISHLTVLCGRTEASALVVCSITFDVYAAAKFFCIVAGILLWVLF